MLARANTLKSTFFDFERIPPGFGRDSPGILNGFAMDFEKIHNGPPMDFECFPNRFYMDSRLISKGFGMDFPLILNGPSVYFEWASNGF